MNLFYVFLFFFRFNKYSNKCIAHCQLMNKATFCKQVHSYCVFTCSYYIASYSKFTGVCLSHAVCVYSCEKSPLHNLICFTAVLTVCRRHLSGIVCVMIY